MKLLEQINENGTTVIVVTHNREIVNSMQKRVVTLKKGVIVSDEEKGGYIDEDYYDYIRDKGINQALWKFFST